ncbi:MAG: hypothetical protein R6V58_04895 [Planctomycetota bacterium]
MVHPPDDFDDIPYDEPDDSQGGELFESERNMERILDYLRLFAASNIQQTGSFDDDDLAVHFTVSLDDSPQSLDGFACFVKDAWVDVCLLRDWSPDIRLKFRERAADIMNTIGSHGVSLYFVPDEDTLYLSHRIFSEGLNFDVFRASVWSLVSAQSRVAAILEAES